MADVEARTVPLPDDLTALLARIDEQLDRLTHDAPLAALKAVAALERTTQRFGGRAAAYVDADEIPDETLTAGLGLTADDVRARLLRYRLGGRRG
ncbi:hypothetical protein [Streptomyces sp. Da 82-17]|uniref:hypothetical protein n=1 Tax=Streptomyces sp. Da 82-17 TaxID=3377116 RepID=UPI0038D4785F